MSNSKEVVMPKVSAKRQITLPIDQCKIVGIEPGDEYESYVDNHNRITIIKKTPGAASGILKGTTVANRYTDEDSLASGLAE